MKTTTSKISFALGACLIFTSIVMAGYIAPTRNLSIPATVDTIVFDGIDNENSYSLPQDLTRFNSEGYTGITDFGGYFKICWDNRFLYFYANIIDDIDHSISEYDGNTWMYDNIEIYIDLDITGNDENYTDHTIQLRYNRGWNRVIWPGRAEAGDYYCLLANKPSNDGWVLETAIPWTCALPEGSLPEDINDILDGAIGFDVIFSDSDGSDPYTGMRDIQAAWDTDNPNTPEDRTEDNAWNNRKVFGVVEFLGNPLPAPTDTPPPPPVDPPFVPQPPSPPPVIDFVEFVQPVATMSVPATVDTIYFDGIDDELSYSTAQTLTTCHGLGVTDETDFSGYFKTSWDSTYLYIFAKISDDIDHSNLGGGNDWEFDNLEVFIDLDTGVSGQYYDDKTVQIRFNRGWPCVSNSSGRATADDFYYYSATTPENDGWVVEAGIPWISAMPYGSLPEDIIEYLGNSMGFEVMGADSDGDNPSYGMRDGQSSWDMDGPDDINDRTEDNAWNNTRVFGIIELLGNPIISPPVPPLAPPAPVIIPGPEPWPVIPPTVPPTGSNFANPIRSMHIPHTDVIMSMDGIANENSYSSTQTLEVFNGTGLDGTADDFNGYFKVCWDYTYLYFFADITDDINHSCLGDFNAWTFDNVELYLDLAIDSSFEYYDDNAIQIRFNRGIDYPIWPGRAELEEYKYFWQNKPDSTGWIVEAAVPWTAAMPEGKDPQDIEDYIYNNMGFDVIFSDSDGDDPDIGNRDVQMAWDMDDPDDAFDRTEDNAWNNTHVFGVINLFSSMTLPQYRTIDIKLSTIPDITKDEIDIYPNPTDGLINFENIDNVASIEILDLLGRSLKKVDNLEKQLTISLNDISNEGVFFAKLLFKDGTLVIKKIILK